MTKSLDLGCGAELKNPYRANELFGVDVREDLPSNIRKADLVIEPIPYDDESFDYITAYDFIEHIPRIIYAPSRRNPFIELMNEAWRVLKPGGVFLSHTPALPHLAAFQDPTHVNIITEKTFPNYFCEPKLWASIYGFNGAFLLAGQKWSSDYHLITELKKTPHRRGP